MLLYSVTLSQFYLSENFLANIFGRLRLPGPQAPTDEQMKECLKDALHVEDLELCEAPDTKSNLDALRYAEDNLKSLQTLYPNFNPYQLGLMQIKSEANKRDEKSLPTMRKRLYQKYFVSRDCRKAATEAIDKYHADLADKKFKAE